jgi:hypothetical protein
MFKPQIDQLVLMLLAVLQVALEDIGRENILAGARFGKPA